MTDLATGDINLPLLCLDQNLTRDDFNPDFAKDNFISSQPVKISNSQPRFHYDPSQSKRQKWKPARFADFQTDIQMEDLSPKKNIKSSTKSLKGQVLSSPTMNQAVDIRSSLQLSDGKTATVSLNKKKNKHPESLSSVVVQKRLKKLQMPTAPPSGNHVEHLGNDNKEAGSKVLECSGSSELHLSFEEVTSFEDFRILVNGVSIDHEMSHDDRMGYYKLCFCKKEFLHPEGINGILAGGMIAETVKTVNEIKKCTLTTAKEEFEKWDKYLKSFEGLGMKVGFLRNKIRTLARLVSESEGAPDVKQYTEETMEHKRIKGELKKVADKHKELMESAKKIGGVWVILKEKVEKYEQKFKEEANVPW